MKEITYADQDKNGNWEEKTLFFKDDDEYEHILISDGKNTIELGSMGISILMTHLNKRFPLHSAVENQLNKEIANL